MRKEGVRNRRKIRGKKAENKKRNKGGALNGRYGRKDGLEKERNVK